MKSKLTKKIIFSVIGVFLIILLILGLMPNMFSGVISEEYINVASAETPELVYTSEYITKNPIPFTQQGVQNKYGYSGKVVEPQDGQSITYNVNVAEAGDYNLYLDLHPTTEENANINYFRLYINDELYIVDGYEKVTPNIQYVYPYNDEEITETGYEVAKPSNIPYEWQTASLYDQTMKSNKVNVPLKQGQNTVRVEKVSGDLAFGNMYIEKINTLPTYEQYIKQYENENVATNTYYVQGEEIAYKNKPEIIPSSSTSMNTTPFDINVQYLNTLDAETFKQHNNSVSYLVDMPESGLYNLGFSVAVQGKENIPTYTNIYINDQIPFDEFYNYKFDYTNGYKTVVDDNLVYFNEGINKITVEINQDLYYSYYTKLNDITEQITNRGIEIGKLTSGVVDKNRTWNMDEYFPELTSELEQLKVELMQMNDELYTLYDGAKNENNLNIELAIKQVDEILKDIDSLPNQLSLFSQGSNSIMGRLSLVIGNMMSTGLSIDTIYLTNPNENLEAPDYGVLPKTQKAVKELLLTFSGSGNANNGEALEVWTKQPKQMVDVMQQLIDEDFTPNTGIEVDLSLMSPADQQKLTLANAAGTNPDVATGVDGYYISDIGQRGALEDLSTYDGVKDIIKGYAPGAMMQLYVEDEIYGLIEKQEFYIQIYRKDILDKYNLEPANTWDDVKELSAVLQANNMTYFTLLSKPEAFKTYPATAPFFFQNGAEIFAKDGFSTEVGSEKGLEAFELMTELYTINGLDTNVASFYESFRDGTVPIGVTEFSEYLKIFYGAPELYGKWDIALVPGTQQEDGTIDRTTTGSSSGTMMFSNSDKKDEGWEFIQWWLSPETQSKYLNRVVSTYGPTYVFVPASLEVLNSMPFPKEHIDVIQEQVQWVREVQRIPGGYVAEREISTVWNDVVVDGKELRDSVENCEDIINQELERKMEEFGYIEDGEVVKPYKVNRVEDLERWLND